MTYVLPVTYKSLMICILLALWLMHILHPLVHFVARGPTHILYTHTHEAHTNPLSDNHTDMLHKYASMHIRTCYTNMMLYSSCYKKIRLTAAGAAEKNRCIAEMRIPITICKRVCVYVNMYVYLCGYVCTCLRKEHYVCLHSVCAGVSMHTCTCDSMSVHARM